MKSQSNSISFANPIRILKDNYSKVFLTTFLGPIITVYINFEEKLEEAFEAYDEEIGLSEDNLELFIEAISLFDIYEIKQIITDYPLVFSRQLLEDDNDKNFIVENYPEFNEICDSYKSNEQQVQAVRNSLYSYTRILNSYLLEMERAAKSMENLFNQSGDTTAKTRSGLTGGSVGGILGSLLLPGVGTVLGGFLGGYLMGKSRNNKIIEQISDNLDNYIINARELVKTLVENSKELYMIFGRIYDEVYVKNDRSIYFEINKISDRADEIFVEYYKDEIRKAEEFLKMKIDEDDPDTITWEEYLKFVHDFIKN